MEVAAIGKDRAIYAVNVFPSQFLLTSCYRKKLSAYVFFMHFSFLEFICNENIANVSLHIIKTIDNYDISRNDPYRAPLVQNTNSKK